MSSASLAGKKLMVLGASLYQLEVICWALDSGLTVFTLDNRPENPGHRLAHRSFTVDTTDYRAVFAVAQELGIDGIIAPATDVALPTAAYVAEKLGLSGPGYAAAKTFCDKAAFRRLQQRLGLPVPGVATIGVAGPGPDLFSLHSWIIKPTRSSGSKGVFIVDSLSQYLDYLPQSRAFSLDQEVILEEYIDGFQGTVEGRLNKQRIEWAVFLDRQTATPPYVATYGHHLPTRLAPSLQSQVIAQLEKIFTYFALEEGPFDVDFVISSRTQECYIIEMSPRLGGNSIARLIHLAGGGDMVKYVVMQALACPDIVSPPELPLIPTAVRLLGVEKCGFLLYNEDYAASLRAATDVPRLVIEAAPASRVEAFINGRHRLGELFIQAPSRDLLDERVRESLAGLDLRVSGTP